MKRNRWNVPFIDLVKLGIESQSVIALRLAKVLKGGPAAASEMRRMVSEKAAALAETSTMLAFGAGPKKIVRRYRRHVKSNQRRLRIRK